VPQEGSEIQMYDPAKKANLAKKPSGTYLARRLRTVMALLRALRRPCVVVEFA
jgi:hypothetical protein